MIVAMVASNSTQYCAAVGNPTVNGFIGIIFHRDGVAATVTGLLLQWIAVQTI
jgi:hypothetical protein